MGAEALIRWRHPERGLVSPADLHAGCQCVARSQTASRSGSWKPPAGKAACGSSRGTTFASASIFRPRSFSRATLRRPSRRCWRTRAFRLSLLELEVTENILLEDDEGRSKSSARFRELGVQHRLRRLRHRLCQPDLSEEIPARPAENRQVVRARTAWRIRTTLAIVGATIRPWQAARACRSLPKASRTAPPPICCRAWAARKGRAIISAIPCRPRNSSGGSCRKMLWRRPPSPLRPPPRRSRVFFGAGYFYFLVGRFSARILAITEFSSPP